MNGTPYDAFRKRLEDFARELPEVGKGSVEALHRARVASRRLRETLPLLALDHDTARKLGRQLRRATERLGNVRELDVLMALIGELGRSRRYPAGALTTLSQTLGHSRDAARERLAADLPGLKLERLAIRLERTVNRERVHAKDRKSDAVRARRASLWALDARIARRAARVRTAIELAGGLYSPEPLHRVRIALKKFRYAVELSVEAGRVRLSHDVATLKAAQDLLGRLHDYEVLVASGRDVQASLFPPDVAAWRQLKLLVHAVQVDCRQMHARYMRDRARLMAIADRLGAGEVHASAGRDRAAG